MNMPRSWKNKLGNGHEIEQSWKRVNGPILAAEDDDDDFLLLVLALEKAGIKNPVIRVSKGQDTLDYIERTNHYSDPAEHSTPALVFLDLKMAVMDGIDVLAAMHSKPRKKEIPIIVLSSSVDRLTMDLATRLGAKECHQKPVEFRTLVLMVREICGRWLGPTAASHSHKLASDMSSTLSAFAPWL
jgi:CheY-like chemotaxis protein